MKVVFLGTGTGVPVPTRGYAGIYVRVSREHILLDAGPGTLRQLSRLGITHLDLDRIFLTHFHPDHCLDLVSILFAMRIPQPALRNRGAISRTQSRTPRELRDARRLGARTKPLTIYGPRGLRRLYRQLNTTFQRWIQPRTYRLTLKELGETSFRAGRYRVTTRRMNHARGRALGYRLEAGGRSLAYSGDTDACPGIVALGRRTDLLILECSMTDERKVEGHLTPSVCGRIGAAAECRHLALTHFYPVFRHYNIPRRVRRHFAGRLTLARDFQLFTL